jgi:esterase/lipase
MPHIQINGASIYYEEHGDGPETLIFSRGLLWSGYLFHNQIDVLKDRYRCVTDQLGRITSPTLIIVGDQDVATVPEKAEKMHAGISTSRLVIIPGAGHTSPIEEPEVVTAAMVEFLDSQVG